jgi:CRP/FNR family transcriptional regulator/CRP/FNR family cyclic AMP-dependent transcriptional regulator
MRPELLRLRANPALDRWDEADLRALAEATTLVHVQQGQALCRQGESARDCWLLLSGQVEVFRTLAGVRVTVARFGVGAIVGQIALLDGTARSASIEAATDIEALRMDHKVFARLLRDHAPLALHFQRQIALASGRQLQAATEQLASTLGHVQRHGSLREEDLDYIRRRLSAIRPQRPRSASAAMESDA